MCCLETNEIKDIIGCLDTSEIRDVTCCLDTSEIRPWVADVIWPKIATAARERLVTLIWLAQMGRKYKPQLPADNGEISPTSRGKTI